MRTRKGTHARMKTKSKMVLSLIKVHQFVSIKMTKKMTKKMQNQQASRVGKCCLLDLVKKCSSLCRILCARSPRALNACFEIRIKHVLLGREINNLIKRRFSLTRFSSWCFVAIDVTTYCEVERTLLLQIATEEHRNENWGLSESSLKAFLEEVRLISEKSEAVSI